MSGRSSTATSVRRPPARSSGALDKRRHGPSLLAVSVMPGPQLTQAVDVCRKIRESRPDTPIVWGGYFPDAARRHGSQVAAGRLRRAIARRERRFSS